MFNIGDIVKIVSVVAPDQNIDYIKYIGTITKITDIDRYGDYELEYCKCKGCVWQDEELVLILDESYVVTEVKPNG
jgi:hypothetical protein